jgi:hypothetical protein
MDSKAQKKGIDKTVPFNANIHTSNDRCIKQRYEYIPIDFIKVQILKYKKEHFINNPLLEFTHVLDKDEVKYLKCTFENFTLKIYVSGYIVLSGSIHKYFNNGLHNYNDFNKYDFDHSIQRLTNFLNIETSYMYIIQLEYGFNLNLDIQVDSILNNLMIHKRVEMEQPINDNRGKYNQFKHSNYIIKIYDKGKQYKQHKNILRIEIKQINWSEYRLKGIRTMYDFILQDKLPFLNYLISKWNEILFFDPLNKDEHKWSKYSNKNFWIELNTKSNPTYHKHQKRLFQINSSYGTQNKISESIISKQNQLQGVTNFEYKPKTRKCLVTGLDITNQKENSFLLSHSGLYQLLDNDNTTFDYLRKRYLTPNWQTSSTQIQVKEIAHNIRNKYFNNQHKYNPNQLLIF